MSETRDKRRRSDLDLFVLALVSEGISTPYSLKTVADLSPGATIPALRRLLEDGLLVLGKPGSRGRTEYGITPVGRFRLKNGWRELIYPGPSGDADADLRIALLTLWAAGDRRLAADFLRRSATLRLESVVGLKELDRNDVLVPEIASWYRRLRAASAKALIKGESDAILSMAKGLPRLNGKRKKAHRTKSKS